MELFYFFIAGFIGALAKDIFRDGYIIFPHVEDGKFFLGFLGNGILGGVVGILVDHTLVTAVLGGYVGFSIVEGMLIKRGFNGLSNNLAQNDAKSLRDNNSGRS